MKTVYPIILTETDDKKIPYLVYVPDFDAQTQGTSLADALHMAEDLISLMGAHCKEDGRTPPTPSRASAVDPGSSPWHDDCTGIISETVTLVSVDFEAYQKKLKGLSVRRNVTIPAWLDEAAREAGVNVSATLQEALKAKLGVA